MNHETSTEKYHEGIKAFCSCGWIDRWRGPDDGSAAQSAAEHARRHKGDLASEKS